VAARLSCVETRIPVELRGIEPLTPTLPGPGKACDQAKWDPRSGVAGVVRRVTVARVVVRSVVNEAQKRPPIAASDRSACGGR
jgi:hypothetical protein